jgi:hypothetical protein
MRAGLSARGERKRKDNAETQRMRGEEFRSTSERRKIISGARAYQELRA